MLLILSYLFSVKISLKIIRAPDDNFRPLSPEEFILAMSCPSYISIVILWLIQTLASHRSHCIHYAEMGQSGISSV